MALSATLLSHPEAAKRSELLVACSAREGPSPPSPCSHHRKVFLPSKNSKLQGVYTTQNTEIITLKRNWFKPTAQEIQSCGSVSKNIQSERYSKYDMHHRLISGRPWDTGNCPGHTKQTALRIPKAEAGGISTQKLIWNDGAFLWCDDLYCLYNNRNTGSKKYTVINGK